MTQVADYQGHSAKAKWPSYISLIKVTRKGLDRDGKLNMAIEKYLRNILYWFKRRYFTAFPQNYASEKMRQTSTKREGKKVEVKHRGV